MEKNKAKSVGIWIRVSTEDQAKGESPEHHEQRARFYAEAKEWQVKEVYHLEAVSGKSVMGNPETKRMLEHIRSGHITGLIFSKLARLARNTRELLEFAEIFREDNADLISLQESIDTSTPAGRLFYTMIAAMAQWEREEIADRVAASVPIRAKLGKPLGGDATFGYSWHEKRLVPNSQEAPIRKLIYELFLEHRRKRTVARLLNEKGYRTRNGSKFSDTTITRLLRDSTAKGIYRRNYTKSLGDNKKWVMKPKEDWVMLAVEPIVPADLWDQCNLILDEREKKNRRPAKKALHLFTGVAYCACGNKLYVPSNSPKYTCYQCRNKIGERDLEEVFQHQLKTFFFSPTEITSYLGEADRIIKEKEKLLEVLGEEKRKTEREMDKVYRAYINDELEMKAFGKQNRLLTARRDQIDQEIPEIQGEIDFLKIQYLSSDHILNEAKDLYSRWSHLNYDEKRKIVENIVDQIIIDQDDVTINLCYLPTPTPKMMTDKQRNFIPALPFCHTSLKTSKPLSPDYPKILNTLGDHLRKRRLDQKLLQREVGCLLGVDEATIYNWETNRTSPSLPHIPKIIKFIGYVPWDVPTENVKKRRQLLGISQETLANQIGVDPGTVAKWETGKRMPSKEYGAKLSDFFSALLSSFSVLAE